MQIKVDIPLELWYNYYTETSDTGRLIPRHFPQLERTRIMMSIEEVRKEQATLTKREANYIDQANRSFPEYMRDGMIVTPRSANLRFQRSVSHPSQP